MTEQRDNLTDQSPAPSVADGEDTPLQQRTDSTAPNPEGQPLPATEAVTDMAVPMVGALPQTAADRQGTAPTEPATPTEPMSLVAGAAPADEERQPEEKEEPAAGKKEGPPAQHKKEARSKSKKSQESPPTGEGSAAGGPKSDKMDWYILKVQSNREESIREGLRRRIAIAGYEPFFGDIIIPTEKVTEVKGGKKRTYKRKLYPGYLVVQMEINEDTWFLTRETPGIGDFTGAAGHPTPMNPREVQAILSKQEEKPDQQEKVRINFTVGDRVKIKEGTFENFEGEVASIDETNGRVTVLINIFGRSTPVDIEYWQIEAV